MESSIILSNGLRLVTPILSDSNRQGCRIFEVCVYSFYLKIIYMFICQPDIQEDVNSKHTLTAARICTIRQTDNTPPRRLLARYELSAFDAVMSSRSKVCHILTRLRQAVLNPKSNNELFRVGKQMDQSWSLTLISLV